jgi:hypothetical protein
MTAKQKIKSLEQKMARLQNNTPEINLKEAALYSELIQKYKNLELELFYLKFELEHCSKCGKKI